MDTEVPSHEQSGVLQAANEVLCAVLAGCKSNDVQIVYTPWGNLKKTASMDVGQVWLASSSCIALVQY
jgi:hypothetical protein